MPTQASQLSHTQIYAEHLGPSRGNEESREHAVSMPAASFPSQRVACLRTLWQKQGDLKSFFQAHAT